MPHYKVISLVDLDNPQEFPIIQASYEEIQSLAELITDSKVKNTLKYGDYTIFQMHKGIVITREELLT